MSLPGCCLGLAAALIWGGPLSAQGTPLPYVPVIGVEALVGVDSVRVEVVLSWDDAPAAFYKEAGEQEVEDVFTSFLDGLGIVSDVPTATYAPSLQCNVTVTSAGPVVGVSIMVSLRELLPDPAQRAARSAITWYGLTTMTMSPETVRGLLFAAVCARSFERDWKLANPEAGSLRPSA